MQSGVAAILPGPAWLWPDQAHARARRVKMHFVRRAEKIGDIGGLEKIRRAVRSVEHRDRPFPRINGHKGGR